MSPTSKGSPRSDEERFLSSLAHDLRNLLEALDLTIFGTPDAPKDPSIRAMTYREIYGLIRKTEMFLDEMRLARGHLELQVASVELGPTLQGSLEKMEPFLEKKRVISGPATESLSARADRGCVEKILTNLLYHAAQLTGEDEEIRARLGRGDDETVYVDVSFAPLESQVDLGELLRADGVGGTPTRLGLSVSRELARLQGGDLVVERDPPHGTARLRLLLPQASVEAKPRQRGTSEPDRRRVLIVDDNVDTAKTLAALVRLSGHDTVVCHDGESALREASTNRLDVVLLDLGLPSMDGYEVCRRLRGMEGGENIMLIAVSGYGDSESRSRSREAGFDAHLLKPVDHDELVRLIERSREKRPRG